MIRIDKYLSDLNFGSRKDIKKILKEKVVKVNDNIVDMPNFKLDIDKDIVTIKGRKLDYVKDIYLMINKPKNYICATKDNKDKTILDLVDRKYKKRNIFPAGRLDKDTEGFVLLTNDGNLSHYLLSPKNKVEKKYYVKLKKRIRKEDKDILKQPIFFKKENIWTSPAELEIIDPFTCYLTICEGKFHQVKRMFLHISNEVTYLKRVKIGNLELDDKLKLGEYRSLTSEEIDKLKSS